MSRATPIDNLPSSGDDGSSGNLVNDIMKQMDNENAEADKNYQQEQDQYQDQQFGVHPYPPDMDDDMQEPMPVPPKKRLDAMILDYVKEPLIIMVLFVVLNQKVVDTMLMKFIPKLFMLGSDMPSVVFKAAIAAAIFFLLKFFVL